MKQVLFRCKKGYLKVNECADDQKELPSNISLMVYHPVKVPNGLFPECVECKDCDDEGVQFEGMREGTPALHNYKSCSIDIEIKELS
ncbi:MAG: hypothetical protein GQ576_00410 [Methanococcoides sp.]|nr:hypothetical protein [Methanococcoides sp.]